MIETSGTIDVQPGEYVNKQIVCPKSAPQRASVRLACDWPNDLESERLVLYVRFQFSHLETVPGIKWTRSNAREPNKPHAILFGPSDLIATYIPDRNGSQAAPSAKAGPARFFDIREADLDSQPPGALVELDSGSYDLIALMVLRELPAAEPGRKRFECLAIVYPPAYSPGRSGFFADITIQLPPEYWQKAGAQFVATVGANNKWMMPQANELIEAGAEKRQNARSRPRNKRVPERRCAKAKI